MSLDLDPEMQRTYLYNYNNCGRGGLDLFDDFKGHRVDSSLNYNEADFDTRKRQSIFVPDNKSMISPMDTEQDKQNTKRMEKSIKNARADI